MKHFFIRDFIIKPELYAAYTRATGPVEAFHDLSLYPDFGDIICSRMSETGFEYPRPDIIIHPARLIDARHYCRHRGRRYSDWCRNKSTATIERHIEAHFGPVKYKQYIHPLMFIHLANWVDPTSLTLHSLGGRLW